MTRRTYWPDCGFVASGAPRGVGTGSDEGPAAHGDERHEDAGGGEGFFDGSSGEDMRGTWRRGGGGSRRAEDPRGSDSCDGGHDSLSPEAGREEPAGDPAERARAICLRLLTGTPRTRKQLADALRRRNIPDEAAEGVLSRFEEAGLIDDSAFANAWVESRHHGRGLARRALARELRTRGVDSTLVDAAVSRLAPEQEESTARELVARRLRSTRGVDRDKRIRRLAGLLARKGYPEGLALRVVRQALEEEEEEFPEGDGY